MQPMTEPNPHPALPHLLAFALGTLPLADFEAWVYATPDLELALGRDVAMELLELDFRAPGVEAKLRWRVVDLVEGLAGPAFLVRERARLLLHRLADGSGEVIPVFAGLARLEDEEGGEWLGSIFTAIDAELEDIPLPRTYSHWQPEALARRLAEMQPVVERCTVEAREAARRLLATEFGEEGGG
jgi:hypothetical protein